jgi:predicted glycoside hydrolase/deacetylase ChbG (UPF0249 family)
VNSLRSLIVNADDFGISRGVNRGIAEAHEHGIVTSASLMVDRPAAEEAAAYARARPQLSVGLHVELRRWRAFRATTNVRRQLERFRRLVGADPTHLDSHRHQHREEPLRSISLDLADELDVPLRHFEPTVQSWGDFYGQIDGRPNAQAIDPGALVGILERLPAGVTELSCHPGYADGLKEWYRDERVQEVQTLCDPDVLAAITRLRIRLISFRELPARMYVAESSPLPADK